MHVRTGFVTQLGMDRPEAVAAAAELGYDFVELMLDGDGARNALAPRRDELRRAFDERGVDCTVHLPFGSIDPGSPFDAVRSGALAELEAHVELAAALGAEKATLHPTSDAWGGAYDDEALGDHIVESVRRLDGFAADHGVEIVAENIPRGRFDTNRMAELLERTDVSMCLDTGHARVDGRDDGGIAALVDEHADRISHFHLNDVRGPSDEHLPIGAGFVDFARILRALPDDWEGTLSAEVFTRDYGYLAHSADRLDDLLAAAGVERAGAARTDDGGDDDPAGNGDDPAGGFESEGAD